ncbi:MAG: inositol monophosphatase [Tannerellaceae bacterium]|nr:inositol monophosphatase [Tannerellaceae bacterium]
MNDLNKLCSEVQQIARNIGDFLRTERENFKHISIEEKSAHNYVTNIDRESEQRLVKCLSDLLPDSGFIAEEGSATRNGERYCWVIDPLDGTTNFIHNNAPYCVSIALTDERDILLGVVYEVCRDECFHACRDGKAWLNDKELHVTETDSIDKAFIALGFPYSFDAYKPMAVHLVNRLYGHAKGCRLQGSAAAELCYVAAGRFDARIEACLGPWDVAAGGLILMQAGGRLTNFAGENKWQTGETVLASNGKIHDHLLDLIKEVELRF